MDKPEKKSEQIYCDPNRGDLDLAQQIVNENKVHNKLWEEFNKWHEEEIKKGVDAVLRLIKEKQELETVLDAWHSIFQTSQLSHASERLSVAERTVERLQKQLTSKDEEIERLSSRDCNATIELCYDTKDIPFKRETLKILDVGVSDNIYIVESGVLTLLQEETRLLKDALDREVKKVKGLKEINTELSEACKVAEAALHLAIHEKLRRGHADNVLEALKQAIAKAEGIGDCIVR